MKLYYKNIAIVTLAVFLSGCATTAPHFRMDSALEKDIKTFDGTQYIPLTRLCDVYGLEWKWDPFIKTLAIEKDGKYIKLRAGSDRILINGKEARLDRQVVLNGGAAFVPVSFVRNNLSAVVGAPSHERMPEAGISKRYTIKTIVIDAGHGGKDPGAIGKRLRLREKNMTLDLSRKLKERLEGRGIKVVMTRETDVYVPLQRRVEITNRANADLFVSVHMNSSRSRSLKGFECYYLSDATDDNARAIEAFENASLKTEKGSVAEHSRSLDKTLWDMTLTENRLESAELAGHICGSVEESLSVRNRGIKSARFYVLKGTRIPSVLVETGYISNRYEEMKLKDPAFTNRIIDAIAKGILAYKDEYERTAGFTRI